MFSTIDSGAVCGLQAYLVRVEMCIRDSHNVYNKIIIYKKCFTLARHGRLT